LRCKGVGCGVDSAVSVPLADVEPPLALLLLLEPPSLLSGAVGLPIEVVSMIDSVGGGAVSSGVLDVEDISLRMAPDAAGSMTDVMVLPSTSCIGLDRETV